MKCEVKELRRAGMNCMGVAEKGTAMDKDGAVTHGDGLAMQGYAGERKR